MITRRLALFRLAAASAVTAAVAAPAVLMAVQPKNPENLELIKLGKRMTKLDGICRQRSQDLAKARAAYEAACPKIPERLMENRRTRRFLQSEKIRDYDGKIVWDYSLTPEPQRYHTLYNLQSTLEPLEEQGLDNLSDGEKMLRQFVLQLIPIAEQYEQGVADAAKACGLPEASAKHLKVAEVIYKVSERIGAISAATPEGITIKAQAYETLSAAKGNDYANSLIAPGLAADVCRILSEGGEA